MSRLMFVGTGAQRRKYAGQKEVSTYAWAGDPDALPEPGEVVVMTAAGEVNYGANNALPLGTVEHVDSDGMIAVCRYGITVTARVAAGFNTTGVTTVVVNGSGLLQAGSDGAGRVAIVDTVADGEDGNRWAAVTLL